MGRNRFQPPDVERIPLSDGDWIEIKKDLNNGDSKKHEAAGLKPPAVVDGKIISPVNWETYDIERAAIFLVDWSFRDKYDKPTRPSIDTIKALRPEDFAEVNTAIFRHVMTRAAEKAAHKAAMDAAVGEQAGSAAADTPPSESEPATTS